jgi:acyl-CoA thioester hydrolase
MKIRVYYEDTDLGGVVYHSNYLKYCERARSELFFENGSSPVMEEGHFVVRNIKADFKSPAKFADILHVKSQLLLMKGASFSLLQEIYREEELLFSMEITLVFVTHEGRVTRISAPTALLLERIINNNKL